MKIYTFLVFFIIGLSNTIAGNTRGLSIMGHGSGRANIDPITLSILGLPASIDLKAGGDVYGKNYLQFGVPVAVAKQRALNLLGRGSGEVSLDPLQYVIFGLPGTFNAHGSGFAQGGVILGTKK